MNDKAVPTDLIRDLMQCVQAARDGAHHHSLFAMQCDLVLERAAQVLPYVIVARSGTETRLGSMDETQRKLPDEFVTSSRLQ